MTAEYVVFDVGNVLIRWDARLVFQEDFASDAEIEAFMDEIDFATWNVEQDRGRSWEEGVALIAERFPHYAGVIAKYDHDWQKSVPGEIAGTVEILRTLQGAGKPTYAITNYSAEKWAESVERFPFLKSGFRDIVVSAHESLIKPDPAIFELFLRRNGLEAGKGIFVDDSAKNIATAAALGFDAILFTSSEDLHAALTDRGVL